MKKLIGLILFVFFIAPTAYAQCYSQVEAEADQGIRIHSELMVVGLNCQAMGARSGMNLYGDYRAFTSKHAELFGKYEKILMKFYQKNGMDPKVSLNTLRTNYANNISDKAAKMRPDIFCAKNAERITRTKEMGELDVRKWASTFYEAYPVSYPQCKAQ